MRDARAEILVEMPGRDQPFEEQFRMQVRDYAWSRDFLPRFEHDASCPSVRDNDFRHRCIQTDFDAEFLRFACHCLRDRAHAAEGVSPGAALAVHFAEDVMQQHVGRSRRVRARIVADHRIEAEDGLDRFRFEPGVEKVGGAAAEQREQIALCRAWQPPQLAAVAGGAEKRGEAAARRGRRGEREFA